MDSQFGLGRFCLAVVAVGLMFYGYQYAMSQAIHTVIASQPPIRSSRSALVQRL